MGIELNAIEPSKFFELSHHSEVDSRRANNSGHDLKSAAQDFEAVFLTYLLRTMRQSMGKSNLFGNGVSQDIYSSMFDEAIAQAVARKGGLGLADIIIRNLQRDRNTGPPDDLRTLPDYRAFPGTIRSAPEPNTRWDRSIITSAAKRFGVDPKLVAAIIEVESNFDANAISKKGAAGLMQLMKETADELGVRNRFDPGQNVYGGVQYLKSLLDRFDGNLELALSAYNAGPRAVEKHRGVPPYPETQRYVQRVLEIYHRI